MTDQLLLPTPADDAAAAAMEMTVRVAGWDERRELEEDMRCKYHDRSPESLLNVPTIDIAWDACSACQMRFWAWKREHFYRR